MEILLSKKLNKQQAKKLKNKKVLGNDSITNEVL